MIALDQMGIECNYYASEVDKHAVKVAMANYPDIIHMGCVKDIKASDLPKIDLLIGGSPCQDLSIAKSNREGLAGSRSGLFWEYIRLYKEINPSFFILENVASMGVETSKIISKALRASPVKINSALVTAQNRVRYYWTPSRYLITQPLDEKIYLKDIIEEGVVDREKSYALKHTDAKGTPLKQYMKGKFARQVVFKGRAKRPSPRTPKDVLGIYTVPRGFNKGGLRETDKAPPITSNAYEQNNKLYTHEGIRKLTPIECERLQGLTPREQSVMIRVCLDPQRNSVNAETQNLKLQKSVGSVGKGALLENVKYAGQNFSTKSPPKNKPALPDVHIYCEENAVEIHSQGKCLLNVNHVAERGMFRRLKGLDVFVQLLVSINTIVGKLVACGRAESLQKSRHFTLQKNGSNVVSLYGKGIKQLVKDAERYLTTHNKLSKSTIFDLSTQENCEQNLQTLFSCVVNAIVGYIPNEIKEKNSLTFQITTKVGHTFGVSNTQRYKMIGNGFTIPVIKHILSFWLDYNSVFDAVKGE